MADFWDWIVPNIAGPTNAKVAPTRDQYAGANGRLDPNAITRETLAASGISGDNLDDASAFLPTYSMANQATKSALTKPERTTGQTIGGLLQALAIPVSFAQGNKGFGTALASDNIMTQDADRTRRYEDAQREGILKNAHDLTSNVDKVIADSVASRRKARAEKEAMSGRENVADRFGLQGDQRTGYVLNDKFEVGSGKETDDEKEYARAVKQGFKGTLMDYFAAKKGQKIAPVKEYQTKDAMFSERMERAERNLDAVAGIDETGTPLKGAYNPADAKNAAWPDESYWNSQEWRRYMQSAREGIAAILRKDTGAAVTQSEWDLYFPMYYPQPGDGPEVIKQKKASRQAVTKALRGSAGVAYEQMFGNGDKGPETAGAEVNDYSGMTDEEIKAQMGIE